MLLFRAIASLLVVSLIAGFLPSWLTTREDILSAIRG
jgi:ABC-type antimicrobial peptide transport system permease subunit